jgi:hypothetical protein
MSLGFVSRGAPWVLPSRAVRATGYVWVDTDLLGGAHPDRVDATLSRVAAALDPSSCTFGAAVADLVSRCAELGILACAAPIRAVAIEPTSCDRLCGGFRVLIGIGDHVTVASSPMSPELFRGADELTISVLAAIIEAADHSCRDLLRDAARLARSLP